MVLCNVCVDLLLLINLHETIVVHPLTLLCHDFGVRLTQRAQPNLIDSICRFFSLSWAIFFFGAVHPFFSWLSSHFCIEQTEYIVTYAPYGSSCRKNRSTTKKNSFSRRQRRRKIKYKEREEKHQQQMPFNSLPNNHFISLLKTHYTN